jgi:carboxyl-terminal processing protease
MVNRLNKIVAIFLLAACLSAGVTQASESDGTADEPESPRTQAQLTLDDLRAFTDVFNQIRRNYVGEVDDKRLLDAAIQGMLSDLDPHSDYLPTTEYQDLEENSSGRYSGIGIDVQADDQRITVRAVINDSPADRAGINPGDIITSIDGVPVKGRKIQEAIDGLQGDPGSEVRLTLLSPEGEQHEVQMQREVLDIPTLRFELLDNSYGYFKISFFHRETASHMEETLESLRKDGIELNGVVLDLRDNPGGVLQPAVAMADGFLDEGMIVSTRGQNQTMQLSFEARPGQWLPGVPVVVLVDRGSASASEVLAGALQDHGRALIVGERTFGKGTVQSVLPLRNGGGIKLTTALYYTPSGRSIQAEGILPDVVLDPNEFIADGDDRIRESDLDRHLDQDAAANGAADASTMGAYQEFPVEEVLQILRNADILNGNGTGPEDPEA